MSQRRRVVVRPEFFERLDELLPSERSGTGHPSATDFLLHDLAAIIDLLAEDYEGTTMPVPGTTVRVMVTAGMTVPFVAIYVSLTAEGTVEIISVDFDHG